MLSVPSAALSLALAGAGVAADDAALAPEGRSYSGTAFARDLQSTALVVNPQEGLLQPFLAFEASCRGDRRVGAVWSSNLRTRERLNLDANGGFDQTMTARKRGIGPVENALGRYSWRLRGRLVDGTTLTARLSGKLEARVGKKVVVRCSSSTPVALVLRLDQPATESSTRLPSGSRR